MISATTSCPDCIDTHSTPINVPWLEQRVVLFFRLWHMIFFCSGGLLAVVILLCCCFKCRIPRTKQEIESDFRRNKVTRKFRRELNKMQMEEIDTGDIPGVLDKVREKFHRKTSLPVVHVEVDAATDDESLSTPPPPPKKNRFAQIFTLTGKKKEKRPPKTLANSDPVHEVISMETDKL